MGTMRDRVCELERQGIGQAEKTASRQSCRPARSDQCGHGRKGRRDPGHQRHFDVSPGLKETAESGLTSDPVPRVAVCFWALVP